MQSCKQFQQRPPSSGTPFPSRSANGLTRAFLVGTFLLLSLVAAITPVFAQGTVTLSPATVDFGNNYVGNGTASHVVTLTNTQTVPLTISAVTISGGNAAGDFTEAIIWLMKQPLPPGGSCSINVRFWPSTVGTRTATLSVTDRRFQQPTDYRTYRSRPSRDHRGTGQSDLCQSDCGNNQCRPSGHADQQSQQERVDFIGFRERRFRCGQQHMRFDSWREGSMPEWGELCTNRRWCANQYSLDLRQRTRQPKPGRAQRNWCFGRHSGRNSARGYHLPGKSYSGQSLSGSRTDRKRRRHCQQRAEFGGADSIALTPMNLDLNGSSPQGYDLQRTLTIYHS